MGSTEGCRPLIGLPGRRKTGNQIEGFPEILDELDVDLYVADYARAITAAGGIPVHLPFGVDPQDIGARLDGLVLPGGADVEPVLYGAVAETDEMPPEKIRDDFEFALLDVAEATATPVLGICRGIQLINVWAGGDLHQDVPQHAAFDNPPATIQHEITFTEGSRLRGLYGEHHMVNSMHHQTLKNVGARYRVTGRAEDGQIEAIEHVELSIIAVQWHPEMLPEASEDPLFKWLINASRN
jgi:putative glutamine amidotransferase